MAMLPLILRYLILSSMFLAVIPAKAVIQSTQHHPGRDLEPVFNITPHHERTHVNLVAQKSSIAEQDNILNGHAATTARHGNIKLDSCIRRNDISTFSMENIVIKSDHLKVDKNNNTSYFSGNVVVWCGDFILKTNTLILHKKQGNEKIMHMILPEHVEAMKEDMSEVVVADKGNYDGLSKILILKGNAYIQKDNRIIKCDYFKYHIK